MRTHEFHQPYLLATLPAGPAHKRRAFGVLIVSTLVFLALAPFAKHQLLAVPAFIPLYQSAIVVNDVITAVLLFGQLRSVPSRSLAILAFGYLSTALLTIAHTLSFPGLFAPGGLLGAGMQTTAWLYMFWHAALPLSIIAYATWKNDQITRTFMVGGVTSVILLAAALILLSTAGEPMLPAIMRGNKYTPDYLPIVFSVWAVCPLALLILLRKKTRTVLDLWLTVVLIVWIFEIALSAVLNSGRFDLGFYAGRIYGLLASVFALYVLLLENMALHSSLYNNAAEMAASREREAGHRLLESILRQLPEAVIILDAQGKFLMANDQAARIRTLFGSDAESRNALNHAFTGAQTVSLTWGQVPLPIQRALSGETFRSEEMQVETSAGIRTLRSSGTSVRSDDGGIVASVLVFDDVTVQKAAEKAMQHALAQTRYLVENTPLAVIEWDRNANVTLWNQRAEEIFGWTAAEVIGKRLDSFSTIVQEDGHSAADILRYLEDPDTTYVFAVNRNRTKDGRLVHTEWYNSVWHDDDGAIVTIFSLVLDVTERVQMVEQLQEADRRKDASIATIAHELRNPLAPIYSAGTLLRMKQLPQERVEWVGGIIDRQTELMSRLLDDLLDITRITQGKIKLQKAHTDLVVVLRNAIDTSQPLIENGDHRLSLDLPEGPVYVEADPIRLTQVFANLINNAAKYTERGGDIHIGLTVEGNGVLVTVRDNGIGIEEDMLAHVFKPFAQAERAIRLAQGGLGIGLPLAKGLVELHGGSISVHSDGRGQGSRVLVSLPAASPSAPLRQEQNASSLRPYAINKKILIADDNVDIADSFAVILQHAGAQVEVAYDGARALEMFRQNPAEIAILDVGMPFLNGRDLAMQLSTFKPKPYLIAVSGRGTDEDRIASLAAGFDTHLIKPVTLAKLLEVVKGTT